MTQTREVRGRSTAIFTDDAGLTNVVYHRTAVVKFDAKRVVLNSGGYRTVTTKLRMNQAANQFALGYGVSQRDFEWFVSRWTPEGWRDEVPFVDGMELAR